MKDAESRKTNVANLGAGRRGQGRPLGPPAAVLAAILVLWGGPVLAQKIERIGEFDAWSSYRFTDNGQDGCYMASKPVKAEGKYSKRGDIYALVTHRPAEDRRDEVSIVAGFKYKEGSWVEVVIGSQTYKLFTKDDGAWTPDAKSDKALVQAMIRGRDMIVKGISEHDTKTTDTYSLNGFTKAYKAINKACGG